MAHILLSGTYKSNNFSRAFIVCTLHAQLVCKKTKKSVLSTDNLTKCWQHQCRQKHNIVEMRLKKVMKDNVDEQKERLRLTRT
ncbi:hypothetical protein D1K53_10680 [Salmonella enterica]|nr:hypothetical protein [Salmonella enterica]PVL53546.1 hypothetical protein C4803_15845 [Salmonella enterica subsp. arizonae serovar 51:g,z51:-]EBJ1200850.1 hypothetical protein [Salmonella enterica]EBK5177980.1 hypothetical protein [Salmonella enterica]EBM5603269.1 hypothetical protein [Salmonella enterica]